MDIRNKNFRCQCPLINILKFPEHDENHVAKNFLIQSIGELENGMNFIIYLFIMSFFSYVSIYLFVYVYIATSKFVTF